MLKHVSSGELYTLVSKISPSNYQITCQTLPGLSHYGNCPDQRILTFPNLGLSDLNLMNLGVNPKSLSPGIAYQIKDLPYGQTINDLSLGELKRYYRLICQNCDYEFYINQLKSKNRSEYDQLVYMNIDRPRDSLCKGFTSRGYQCKNPANIKSHLCSAHQGQKIDGINA